MRLSVCIPMYNENKVIASSAKALSDYMQAHFEDYEIIFSNDGSTDGCEKTVEQLNLPRVRVIGDNVNHGKGYAVRKAMLNATGDVRMFMDSDLAYGVDVIVPVANAFSSENATDVLIGSRNLKKDGYENYTLWRKIASKVYIKVVCLCAGFRFSDSQCGCKAYSRKAAELIFPKCEVDGFAFDLETVLWAKKLKLKVTEFPVKIITHGDSKVNVIKDTLKMLMDLQKMKKRIKKANV